MTIAPREAGERACARGDAVAGNGVRPSGSLAADHRTERARASCWVRIRARPTAIAI